MATFTGNFTIANVIGSSYTKFKYRQSGTSTWTTINYASSGTTVSVQITNNLLYDFQLVNVNNSDNPSSLIIQNIGFSDPSPILSPTDRTLGYSFVNLSADIDSYLCTVAEFATPTQILASHTLTPTATVTDTFTGLSPLTEYYLTITPAANQFSKTFTYTFTTTEFTACADPSGITATIS